MSYELAKKLRIILLVIACLVLVACLPIAKEKDKARTHNPEKIEIQMLSCTPESDDTYYYATMDFEIKNKTGSTIDYIEVTTYFSDKNGKSIGTMTSNFGATYSSSSLNLKANDKAIKEIYLSERKSASYFDSLFVELYENGIDDLVITHEITQVIWSDKYRYSR